jgi:tight adherence protein C
MESGILAAIDSPALMLDAARSYLVETLGPAGPVYAAAVLGGLLVLLALPALVQRRPDPLERFSFKDARLESELVRLRTAPESGSLHGLAPLLEPTDKEELSATRRELRAAGYKDPSSVRVLNLSRAALGIGLLSLGLLFLFILPEDPALVPALTISGALGLAGYSLPFYWVRRRIAARRQEMQDAFPDAMDMLLVCIEGGHSLDQAIARVASEIKVTGSPLAEELETVTNEFRAGKERAQVLRDFADRCAVGDISSFVTVLIQSASFGTSISQALRIYAAEMRDKRLMRAEEKANVLPTKLTLGTMAFTVPPLILILAGPSFIQIVRSLTQFGAGQ